MGGDHGADIVIPAALTALGNDPELCLILVGVEDVLRETLKKHKASESSRLTIVHASQTVAMDEAPALALRTKKDSSMRVGINLVKNGEAQACVSAGNTGALMATARFVLRMLPGIDRPAILAALPTMKGYTHVLDLGANIDTRADHLYQFAVMGAEVVKAVENIDRPSVGLLNIGEEEIKGNETVKEAAKMLMQSDLNYIGYLEGDDIYRGAADVVVCDGFVGNVALKTSEGVAEMVRHFLRQEFNASLWRRLVAKLAMPVLRAFRDKIDGRHYNGASLVGLQGIVIKSHGGADALAFANAIKVAKLEVIKAVPRNISTQLESRLMAKNC